MAEKKAKIVVVKENFSAAQVADESVAKVVKSAQVFDAVTTMATDFEPDETSVLHNDDFGLVFAKLTDAEATRMAEKPGVVSVEDDEVVYALQDGNLGGGEDDGGFDDDMLVADDDAAAAIEAALSEMEEPATGDFEISAAEAALAAQLEPGPEDDVAILETGEVISLRGPGIADVEAAGIPRDKLVGLIKCVIKCAIEQFSGQVQEVSDEKISELLAASGLPGSAAAAQAVSDYITCGLRIIYAPQAWRYSLGGGVRVAVLDTGIAPQHPDLRVYGGASFVPGVTSWHDDHYHGTHVAGTIAALANGQGVIGVAPRARLYAVKVLNKNGSGSTSGILNGLAWCRQHRMHIVNLSLGSLATTHDPRVYSRAYEAAGRRLRRQGILPVAAAGNSGAKSQPYVNNPARCPSFMAVAAVDCERRRPTFSSYGRQVEICAPGVKVWSTLPPNRYGQLSGTSMACPHVAGVAALVKRSHPAWGGDEIRVHLWNTARDLGTPGNDPFCGRGLVNAYGAVQ